MPSDVILRIPETVKEDTFAYRSRVRKYLDGQTSAVAFRAYRVPMGVYEQRTEGRFMVRVRIPAGLVLPEQLDKIAGLSARFGNGVLHVTTRQDIQIHDVGIEDTPDVLEGLLEAGLSPRGGGGNTVRNVSACSRAGVCPKEVFDVAPCAVATAEYLLTDRSSFNLPRKYKIAFSGCRDDCAFASVADLGFFARESDGEKGFSAWCAGGLGGSPRVGVKIEDFVPAKEVFEVAQAVKQLFDKHGDRSNKHRARLRYVLGRLGDQEFIRLYRQERQTLQNESLPYEPPEIRPVAGPPEQAPESDRPERERMSFEPEKTPGRVTVRLWLTHGDITAADLKKVARIAGTYGQGLVRTTQLQDLLITGVAQGEIPLVESALADLDTSVFRPASVKTVACAGASTCKLGLCLSRGLAEAISARLAADAGGSDTVVRISGCPNSCGHHCISELGFQGRAKRLGGRLVPYYDVFVGARMIEGQARLAECVGSVPARRVPDLVAEALGAGAIDAEQIAPLVARYADVGDGPLPDECYTDWGADVPFSLAGRGPGECGAGVMDIIVVDIDQAKDAVKTAATDSDSAYKAVVAAARALLVTFGLEPGTDREIFAAFAERLIEPGWVAGSTRQLLDAAMDWRMGDRASIEDLAPQIEDLTARVAELFASLDASLNFTVEPVAQEPDESPAEQDGSPESARSIDLRGVACPMNFVKAKIALEQIDVGEVLEVLLDAGQPARNAPASFAEQGQEVLEVTDAGGYFRARVRRTT